MTQMPDANEPQAGWQNTPPPPPAPMGAVANPNMYAAWPQRALAYLIDAAICAIPGYVLMFIGTIVASGSAVIDPNTGEITTGVLGTLIMMVGYAITLGLLVWNMVIRLPLRLTFQRPPATSPLRFASTSTPRIRLPPELM